VYSVSITHAKFSDGRAPGSISMLLMLLCLLAGSTEEQTNGQRRHDTTLANVSRRQWWAHHHQQHRHHRRGCATRPEEKGSNGADQSVEGQEGRVAANEPTNNNIMQSAVSSYYGDGDDARRPFLYTRI